MKAFIHIILLASFFWSSVCFAENTLSFVGVTNVTPLIYEENGETKGIDYDIFMEISKKMGFKATVKLLPFKRLWAYLQSGKVDGTLQIYYSEPRKEFIMYSKTPMHYSAHYIFVRKQDVKKYKTASIDSLMGKTVGRNSGFFVTKEFDDAMKANKIKVEDQVSTELNLKKLEIGRIDCYVANYHTALYALRSLKINSIVPLPEPFAAKKGTFFALSKNGKNIKDKAAFMERVNKELARIHSDGTLERISKKYLKID